jgi:D-beta-D-heptose 7-phosphate kinase/D-beta-D-heptose 1-phosphate adenosyltransferase
MTIEERVAAWKAEGLRVVFTNGVFDLLHRGHVTYLAAARALGDRLVVGVNDDASVKRLNKGPERPINAVEDRCFVLEALSAVDATAVFSEDTPAALIAALEPDVLVKGGDYDPDETDPLNPRYLVGRDVVLARAGSVVAIPLVAGHSTTDMLRRSKA